MFFKFGRHRRIHAEKFCSLFYSLHRCFVLRYVSRAGTSDSHDPGLSVVCCITRSGKDSSSKWRKYFFWPFGADLLCVDNKDNKLDCSASDSSSTRPDSVQRQHHVTSLRWSRDSISQLTLVIAYRVTSPN
ncbi:hypothetical protein J6590_072092 [Homalodisca vitripennis]|nr:hypothetical protein J6590_072092 [Homalodisca vitripennis]